MAYMVKAQQYVSTEPANKNVIIEEFTGRGCQFCPDGHRVANEIMAANPGRVWAINIHAGSYAQTTYPNFITSDGNAIHSGFSISGYPTGVVNRSTSNGIDRGQWNGQCNTQMNQAAPCNIAGVAMVNPETRMATVTIEVYYTGNSTVGTNYLTVAMLQDSILGSQSGASQWNPTQMINGQYVHMHILRDCITPAWGDVISPTTQGTLITKTYEYPIPESIGSPNGVEVKLEHIFFLAWISEQYQGTPTRPILNACELYTTILTDDPIHPSIVSVSQPVSASCSQMKEFDFEMSNIGQNTITSMKYNVEVGDAAQEFEWNGELVSGDKTHASFEMEIPFGTNTGTFSIFEVNGEPYEYAKSFIAQCDEWIESEYDDNFITLKVYVIQDQWGEQTTWDIINSAGELIAEGGPYNHLPGSGGTQPNVNNVNNVPTDDCYLFRIYDSNNNGICCNYGMGYYYVKDGNGNTLFGGEGNGDFGAMAAHSFMIKKRPDAVDDNTASTLNIYPNPANSKIMVEGENVELVEVYNSLGQRVLAVEGVSETTSLDVASFENGVYVVRVVSNDGVTTKKVSIAH